MRNILLLTDFSGASKNAIAYALQLFKNSPSNFYILHVSDLPTHLADDLVASSETITKAINIESTEQKLKKMLHKIKDELDTTEHTFTYMTKYDYLVKVVKELIVSKNIDLLVMGSNGVTGAKEVIFGSNTLNMIRKVTCTTLVIPDDYSYKPLTEILVPLDEKDVIASDAFIAVKNFFKNFNQQLHFLRINTKPKVFERDKEHLSHLMPDRAYVYHVVEEVPPHHAIDTYIQLNNTDMIALMVHKETFFERLLYGSETTKVSKRNMLPLLIFHTN